MINIDNLTEEQLRSAIQLIPKVELQNYVRRNKRKFSNINKGSRLGGRSKVLEMRAPEAILNEVNKRDMPTIHFLTGTLNEIVRSINSYVYRQLRPMEDMKELVKDIDFLAEIIKTKEKVYYVRLLEVLLDELSPDEINIYLLLNKIELKVRQQKLMEQSIEDAVKLKKIKEDVRKEEGEKFLAELKVKESEFRNELQKEKNNNVKLLKEFKDSEKASKEKIQLLENSDRKQKIEIHNLKINVESLRTKNQNLNAEAEKNKSEYEMSSELDKLLISDLEGKVNSLEKQLSDRYESYNRNYELKWQEENAEKINEKNNLDILIKHLKEDIEERKAEIEYLDFEKEEKKIKVNEYDELVKNFVHNIDKEMIASALKNIAFHNKESVGLNENKDTSKKSTSFYTKEYMKLDLEEIYPCEEIDEFLEFLSENLSIIGLGEIRHELSQYIASALSSKMIPLITGYRTRETAKAISYAYSGEAPLIITLPPGYDDINELMSYYKSCDEKVILIEGLIGQMNESIMLALFKDYVEDEDSNKVLLISAEDVDMVKLLPLYLLEYISVIEISGIKLRNKRKNKFTYSDAVDVIEMARSTSIENVKQAHKLLKKLFAGTKVNELYLISRAFILSNLLELVTKENAMETLVLCDIKVNFKDNEILEDIKNNIHLNNEDFNSELVSLI